VREARVVFVAGELVVKGEVRKPSIGGGVVAKPNFRGILLTFDILGKVKEGNEFCFWFLGGSLSGN
jgi:hypothetical protein